MGSVSTSMSCQQNARLPEWTFIYVMHVNLGPRCVCMFLYFVCPFLFGWIDIDR